MIAAYVYFSAERTQRPQLSERVLDALAKVPRHAYVPAELAHVAYEDTPLPIGYGKTISQPFMVALMTDLLEIDPGDRVLEVGTGLGYQAAILAELAAQVFSIEILEELAGQAQRRLESAGYTNIRLRIGDGSNGWPEHGPFDKIIVTAAPELIPPLLLQQLKSGGKMVIPAGIEENQQLMMVEKDPQGRLTTREILPVRFSPLIVSH
ncbi:MAG: protein-L-isoaspartate(D-aspartate) O-methyltransferase [Alphaproteobacteria bacterium]|nr:MAG: protein-L-isoaspartate(D-aspartate) O-methyltransferase [Alphaproteobacteria bacterium]